MTNKKKNGHSECHIQTRARYCPKVFFDLVCDQFPVQRRSFPGLYTNWKQLDTSPSSVAFMHQLKGIRSAEMLSGARQKSKQVRHCFLATMVNTCSLMRKALHQHTIDSEQQQINVKADGLGG